jgi:hypothetical protein
MTRRKAHRLRILHIQVLGFIGLAGILCVACRG